MPQPKSTDSIISRYLAEGLEFVEWRPEISVDLTKLQDNECVVKAPGGGYYLFKQIDS
jgi:hypothetical protein